MSNKGLTKYRKVIAAAVAATAMAGIVSETNAAPVTFNFYATALNGTPFDGSEEGADPQLGVSGTTPFVTSVYQTSAFGAAGNAGTYQPISGYKGLAGLVPGDEVTLSLFATLDNTNTARRDDGYWTSNGSFLSTGALLGTLRGDSAPPPTTTNNPGPFNTVAQSGYQADLDGDTDLDVGSNQTTGSPNPFPWFVANGGTQAQFGATTTTGGGNTSDLTQWIGETSFVVALGAEGSTNVNYVLRQKTDGQLSDQRVQKFVINNNLYDVDGNGTGVITRYSGPGSTGSAGTAGTTGIPITGAIAIGAPVTLEGPEAPVPEPVGLSLLGLGAGALLRRRSRKA